MQESNIYWNTRMFDLVDFGAEDVGHAGVTVKETLRRLDWVRLALRRHSEDASTAERQTILVSTAHLTCEGCLPPQWYGKNPRVNQTENVAKQLLRLARKRSVPPSFESDPLNDLGLVGMGGLIEEGKMVNEPVLFMGDMNDAYYPRSVMLDYGFEDAFSRLQWYSIPTWPTPWAFRAADRSRDYPSRQIDYMFLNRFLWPAIATVPQFYAEGVAPSDHYPVFVMLELLDEPCPAPKPLPKRAE